MTRLWRVTTRTGLAAVALYATIVACGNDGGNGGSSIELQVLGGISSVPINTNIVRITTPRTTLRKPLVPGDQTNNANWTKFDVQLNEGELVEVAVEDDQGHDLVAGQCTVQGAVQLEYARAIAFYFAPPNNYINCADGFINSN